MSGSSSTTANTTSNTQPGFAPQVGALTTAFNGAQNAYGTASQAVAPTDFTAQMSPASLAAFQQMINQGSNTTTAGQQAGTAGALQTAGTGGVQGALSGLSGFNANTGNNASTVGSNAQSLVDAQNIPAQVAAATQAADEQARDVTMPGIEQNAAAGGNTNSSRTGIADGLVQRGLAENAQNLTGSLTGQAEANAENLAQTQANNNNVDNLGALSSEGSLGNTAASTGVNAGTQSTADQIASAGEAAAGGAGQTAAEQANLTNQEQQFQSAVTSPYAALQGLMGIAGTNNWGTNSTGTNTTTSNPSAWSTISGLLSGGGAALSGLGSNPGTTAAGATTGGSGLLGALAAL